MLIRALLAAILLSGAAFGQVAEPPAVEETPIKPLFNDLTAEQIAEADADSHAFLLKSLLAEAARRKVEPAVTEYLKMSLAAWIRRVNEEAELVKTFGDQAGEHADNLKALLEGGYYAQVFDKEATFGRFMFKHNLFEGEVLQIIDDSNMLVDLKKFSSEESVQTVWLTGVKTEGYIDGSELTITFFLMTYPFWSIDGNRSYTNTLGAKRTVMCMKPHALEFKKVRDQADLFEFGPHWTSLVEVLEKAEEEKKAAEAAKTAAAAEEARRAARTRTWTDASGKFSVEAEFIGLAAGMVKLKKMDGKVIEVKLSVLSPEDQKWVKNLGR